MVVLLVLILEYGTSGQSSSSRSECTSSSLQKNVLDCLSALVQLLILLTRFCFSNCAFIRFFSLIKVRLALIISPLCIQAYCACTPSSHPQFVWLHLHHFFLAASIRFLQIHLHLQVSHLLLIVTFLLE